MGCGQDFVVSMAVTGVGIRDDVMGDALRVWRKGEEEKETASWVSWAGRKTSESGVLNKTPNGFSRFVVDGAPFSAHEAHRRTAGYFNAVLYHGTVHDNPAEAQRDETSAEGGAMARDRSLRGTWAECTVLCCAALYSTVYSIQCLLHGTAQ